MCVCVGPLQCSCLFCSYLHVIPVLYFLSIDAVEGQLQAVRKEQAAFPGTEAEVRWSAPMPS